MRRAPAPDPIVGREDRIDPEHEAVLADAVGLALGAPRAGARDAHSRWASRARAARHVRCALRYGPRSKALLATRGAGCAQRPGPRRRPGPTAGQPAL